MLGFAGRATFAGAVALAASQIAAGTPAVFDVVGDSVSMGVNPELTVDFGWVNMLFGEGGGDLPPPRDESIFDLWPSITAHNSAVSSSTAADWASSESPLLQAVLDHQPDLVVVMIGGNDFIRAQLDGEVTQDELDAVRADLETIIDQLQALPTSPEIIMADYYDLLDGLSENLPPFFAAFRCLSESVTRGNQVIAEVAAAKGCRFVSIYDDFFHRCYGREFGDTLALDPPYVRLPTLSFDIHPVTAGHDAIYREVFVALEAIGNGSPPSGLMLR